MTGVLLWVRHDLRARWWSLVVVAALVALASGTVATAFAGATRGATALDRLVRATDGGFDAIIPINPGASYDWERFDALPYVEARGGLAIVAGVKPVGRDLGDDWLTTAGDDQWFRTIDVPVVYDGRVYDPRTPGELMVTPEFAEANDVRVGDVVRVRLPTPDQATRAFRRLEEVRDPAGPIVECHVVGVVRSMWLTPEDASPRGKAALSPATLHRYAANLLGGRTVEQVTMGAIFRLDDRSDLALLTEDARRISGKTSVDVWDMETKYLEPARDSMVFEARTLGAFGLAALVAGAFLVGGLLARASAAAAERLSPGVPLGMSPRQVALAASLPAALASVVGAGLGCVAAWLVSGRFPLGSARDYEPHPGREVDGLVLPTVLLVTALFCTTVALAAAWRRTGRRREEPTVRVSKVATWFGQASAPVPVVLGARLGLEPQRGRDAVPVRPAQVGAVAAAAGTIAALVFSQGIDDAIAHPERFGEIQQAEAFVGYSGQDYLDGAALRERVAALDYVDGVLDSRQGNATADGRVSMIVYGADAEPEDDPKAMGPVVTDGRPPEASDEVMLGTRTADALGVGLGDAVTVAGSAGSRDLTVVGTGFLPPGAHNGYTDGAWVTASAYPQVFGDDFHFHLLLVHSSTLGQAALLDRLANDTRADFAPPQPVDAVENLGTVRRFPEVLAAFLAVLGIGVVGNALVLGVRRRQGDLAVVRALGLTGGQAAATIGMQSLVLALVGLLYGAPIGLVLGRFLWRTVAETLPLQYVPPASLTAVLWVSAAALLLTALLALLPARRAALLPIAAVLRAE